MRRSNVARNARTRATVLEREVAAGLKRERIARDDAHRAAERAVRELAETKTRGEQRVEEVRAELKAQVTLLQQLVAERGVERDRLAKELTQHAGLKRR